MTIMTTNGRDSNMQDRLRGCKLQEQRDSDNKWEDNRMREGLMGILVNTLRRDVNSQWTMQRVEEKL